MLENHRTQKNTYWGLLEAEPHMLLNVPIEAITLYLNLLADIHFTHMLNCLLSVFYANITTIPSTQLKFGQIV